MNRWQRRAKLSGQSARTKAGCGRRDVLHEFKRKILILEDDDRVLWALKDALETAGYETWTTWSGHDALALIDTGNFDVLLTANYVPDIHVGELLRRISEMSIQPWIIVMEDFTPPRVDLRHYRVLGFSALVDKRDPVKVRQLISSCIAGESLQTTMVN
jgi:CheY-like chemotaxis protein